MAAFTKDGDSVTQDELSDKSNSIKCHVPTQAVPRCDISEAGTEHPWAGWSAWKDCLCAEDPKQSNHYDINDTLLQQIQHYTVNDHFLGNAVWSWSYKTKCQELFLDLVVYPWT